MYLSSQRSDVLFLELTRQVTFHERGLTHTSVSDENEFELGNLLLLCLFFVCFVLVVKGSLWI
jgi:hypothetical protein